MAAAKEAQRQVDDTEETTRSTEPNRPKGSSFGFPAFFTSTPASTGMFGHRRRSSVGGVQLERMSSHNDEETAKVDFPSSIFDRIRKTSKTPPNTLSLSTTIYDKTNSQNGIIDLPCIKSNLTTRVGADSWENDINECTEILSPAKALLESSGIKFSTQTTTNRHIRKGSDEADEKDLQEMQRDLRQLLGDFNSGRLRAFVNSDTLEKMKNVREQQERLARLHFDLHTEQESLGVHTKQAQQLAESNLTKLTDGLKQLNESIHKLCAGER